MYEEDPCPFCEGQICESCSSCPCTSTVYAYCDECGAGKDFDL